MILAALLLAAPIVGSVSGVFGMVPGAPLMAAVQRSVAALRDLRAGPEGR